MYIAIRERSWFERFRGSKEGLNDSEQFGSAKTVKTPEIIGKVRRKIETVTYVKLLANEPKMGKNTRFVLF